MFLVFIEDGYERQITQESLNYGYREGSRNPVWAPDGSKIALTSDRPPAGRIVAMNPDGSEKVILSSIGGQDHSRVWSPDRSSIAFVRYEGEGAASGTVHVMDRNGASLRMVSPWIDVETNPAWSPDGEQLLFSGARWVYSEAGGWVGKSGFFISPVDGTGFKQLMIDDGGPAEGDTVWRNRGAAWSPDGSRIALTRVAWSEPENTYEMLVMDAVGYRISARFIQKFDGSLSSSRAAWSPDGSHVAFMMNDQLFAVSADGGEVLDLGDKVGRVVSWLPDSSSVVLGTDEGLVRVPLDGSGRSLIYEGRAYNPVWSPDGAYILFVDGDDIGITSVTGEFQGWLPRDEETRIHGPVVFLESDG